MGIDLGDVAANEKVFIIRMSEETKTACYSNILQRFHIYWANSLLLLWLMPWIVVDLAVVYKVWIVWI